MTPLELNFELSQMEEFEFIEFVQRFGGNFKTPNDVEDHFVNHPEHERRLCQLLGLLTEDEKLVRAAMASADAAKVSADAAQESARWSRYSVVAAGFGILISAIALVVSLMKD